MVPLTNAMLMTQLFLSFQPDDPTVAARISSCLAGLLSINEGTSPTTQPGNENEHEKKKLILDI